MYDVPVPFNELHAKVMDASEKQHKGITRNSPPVGNSACKNMLTLLLKRKELFSLGPTPGLRPLPEVHATALPFGCVRGDTMQYQLYHINMCDNENVSCELAFD